MKESKQKAIMPNLPYNKQAVKLISAGAMMVSIYITALTIFSIFLNYLLS